MDAVVVIPAVLGIARLDGPLDVPFRAAAGCAECHPEEHADWSGSRHRASWSNALMFEGYVQETQPFCVPCHAPLRAQTDEVLANTAFYRSRAAGADLAPVAPLPEPRADEGVTCVVCHVRDGQVLAVDGLGAHRFRDAPELGTSELCAACHEFPVVAVVNGRTLRTDTLMQGTYGEWRRWGGPETCQDCHLPDGRHLFRGAHDRAFLAGAVAVEVTPDGEGARLAVRSVGVGPDLPTGDVFRHLTLEVDDGGGFVAVARIGRTFRTAWDADLGASVRVLAEDTALRPGDVRAVRVPRLVRWRLRYHYGAAEDEARGRLPLRVDVEELRARVARGEGFRYLLFWGHTGTGAACLSQWYPQAFEVDGERFATAEHWMMAEKARLFGDVEARARILAAPGPGRAKRLGREVRGFDESRWEAERFGIVVRGNVAKFGQNAALREFLAATGSKVLVEASPFDHVWGIGLGRDHVDATNPARWRGLNLLGFALMEARSALG